MTDERPDIFTYQQAAPYVADMLRWKKLSDKDFSVRNAARAIYKCSPALVTLVAQGKRKLTRDRVPALAQLLGLNDSEQVMLQVLASQDDSAHKSAPEEQAPASPQMPRARMKPGLLHPWFNFYLWEASRLKGFRADAIHLFRLLGGIASPQRLATALHFLLRQGLLRKRPDGKIVPEEPSVESTDDVPDDRIRRLHEHALLLAADRLDHVPVQEREASLVLLTLNAANFAKLKVMLKDFSYQITRFSEEHPHDDERLYQVVINAMPISLPDVPSESSQSKHSSPDSVTERS